MNEIPSSPFWNRSPKLAKSLHPQPHRISEATRTLCPTPPRSAFPIRAQRILSKPWPEGNPIASMEWVLERSSPGGPGRRLKMPRRIVEHEREHLEVVRRTARAWAGEPVDPRPWM